MVFIRDGLSRHRRTRKDAMKRTTQYSITMETVTPSGRETFVFTQTPAERDAMLVRAWKRTFPTRAVPTPNEIRRLMRVA